MKSTTVFDQNVMEYEKWYEDHEEVYQSELQALREHFLDLPENIRGIEVGLGTGRFSQPLGIKEGVEPSESMSARAAKRGIETINAMAEHLPYADLQFDFVLFVTICYLKDIRLALSEAHRVLKKGGALIIGLLDKSGDIARAYKERGGRSKFFANARFYSPEYIKSVMEDNGFKDVIFNQTLFGKLEEIGRLQTPKPGYGEGSFVVAKGIKR